MPKRFTQFLPNEFYHIYNRGAGKHEIFFDDSDYYHFIKLLYICNGTNDFNFSKDITAQEIDAWHFDRGEPLVAIGAWVLMPNHFHLIISPIPGIAESESQENNVSRFLRKLSLSFSKYINKKYLRSGTLFQGPYKAKHINTDIYLKYLFSYIHLNPVKLIQNDWKEKGIHDKKGAIEFLDSYQWSSYTDFLLRDREAKAVISRTHFPDYFGTKQKFLDEIFDWVRFNPDTGSLGK